MLTTAELLIELKKCWDEPNRDKGKSMEKSLMIKFYTALRDREIFKAVLSPIQIMNYEDIKK